MRKKSLLLIVLFTLGFMACSESTEPASEENIQDAKQALVEMDQSFSLMMSNSILSMAENIPDLTGIVGTQRLSKSTLIKNLINNEFINRLMISEDDNPFLLLLIFSQLSGTYSHDGTEWTHTDAPQDGLVLEYDFVDQIDGSTKHGKISLSDMVVANTQIGVIVDIYVDEVRTLWTNLVIVGNNLLSLAVDPTITSIAIDGGAVVPEVGTILYEVSLSNTLISVTFGLQGGDSTIITIEGTDLLNAGLTGDQNSSSPISRISLNRNSLTIAIDNFGAEDGDVGDILYDNIKVADLVIENDTLKVLFVNGDENTIAELLPQIFGLMENGMNFFGLWN